MSLILEALRKSEAERRRGAMPNVYAELPPTQRPSRLALRHGVPVGAAAIVLLAALWWVHGRQAAAGPVARAPVVGDAGVGAAPTLPPVRHLTPVATASPASASVAIAATPVPAHDRQPPASRAADPDDAAVLPPLPTFSRPVQPPAVATAATAPNLAAPREADQAMALSDLSVDERKALPALKMSMHMWNEIPARRFVIVDGNRLQEGDRVGEGVLTAIVPDGAILDWNGRRLKLTMH